MLANFDHYDAEISMPPPECTVVNEKTQTHSYTEAFKQQYLLCGNIRGSNILWIFT